MACGTTPSSQRISEQPAKWDGQILVPFPIESALSGVMKRVGPEQRLVYHRTFKSPELKDGRRLLLHFGAVDWHCEVSVNGKNVGEHTGGYDPFTFDVTDALDKSKSEQELIVTVNDPSDANWQPRGKQVRESARASGTRRRRASGRRCGWRKFRRLRLSRCR